MSDEPGFPSKLSERTCRFSRTPSGGLSARTHADPDAPYIPVPRLSLTLVDFVSNLGFRFHRRSHRCLSALLQLDLHRAHWSFTLPPQRCFPTHATWSLKADDVTDFPAGYVMAGSIQTVAGLEDEPVVEELFGFDGLHFIIRLGHDAPHLGLIVIAGGKAVPFSPQMVVHDPIEMAIFQALPDLTAPLDACN